MINSNVGKSFVEELKSFKMCKSLVSSTIYTPWGVS
jgi:hypothetical protein